MSLALIEIHSDIKFLHKSSYRGFWRPDISLHDLVLKEPKLSKLNLKGYFRALHVLLTNEMGVVDPKGHRRTFRPSHDQSYGSRHTFLEQNWFYPLPVENGNSLRAGWISFLQHFLHTSQPKKGTVRRRKMMDTSSDNSPQIIKNV